MKSWTIFGIGVCALASLGALRKRATDAPNSVGREFDRCERILQELNRRVASAR